MSVYGRIKACLSKAKRQQPSREDRADGSDQLLEIRSRGITSRFHPQNTAPACKAL
jgi:hypothetical protein